MTSVDEKPKNDEKRKPDGDGTGCSGCLSIIVFILELFSFFS